jgi:hypothetical protein
MEVVNCVMWCLQNSMLWVLIVVSRMPFLWTFWGLNSSADFINIPVQELCMIIKNMNI